MPQVRFETTNTVFERARAIYASDRAVTAIGSTILFPNLTTSTSILLGVMTETKNCLSLVVFNLVLENAISNAKGKQEYLEVNATHQKPLFYADVNLLS
jgi:hypothetical protein